MDVFLITGASLAFFLGLITLTKKGPVFSDYALSGIFFLFALNIFLSYMEMYNRQHGYPYPFFISVSPPTILLSGPFLWLYVMSLTTPGFRFRWVYLAHLLPFVIAIALFAKGFYSLTASEKIALEVSEGFKDNYIYPMMLATIAVSNLGYTVWGIMLIRGYNRKIKHFFSRLEAIDLRWLKFLLVSVLVFYAAISTMYLLDYVFHFMPYGALQLSGYAMASIYVLVLGYFGLRQGNLFALHKLTIDLEKAGSALPGQESLQEGEESFIKDLLQFMKDKKPYLEPDLTLARLSADLGVSPEYLSGEINGRLHSNFFDFVNRHRVEEFKSRCIDPRNKHLSIIGIALDSGFNSKATFNRVFKNITGLTPGEYKNNKH